VQIKNVGEIIGSFDEFIIKASSIAKMKEISTINQLVRVLVFIGRNRISIENKDVDRSNHMFDLMGLSLLLLSDSLSFLTTFSEDELALLLFAEGC
jgi:hypothetical protein